MRSNRRTAVCLPLLLVVAGGVAGTSSTLSVGKGTSRASDEVFSKTSYSDQFHIAPESRPYITPDIIEAPDRAIRRDEPSSFSLGYNMTKSLLRRASVQDILSRAVDIRDTRGNYTLFVPPSPHSNETDASKGVPRVGIVLLAQGRSGTSSLSESLRASTNLHFCNDIKESFELHNISLNTFQQCRAIATARDKTGFFSHVKPYHILRNYKFKKVHHDLHLQPLTISKFVRILSESSVDLVFAAFRDNQLERHISSFELHASHYPELTRTGRSRSKSAVPVVETELWKTLVRERFIDIDLIKMFESDALRFVSLVRSALREGLRVVQLRFEQYVGTNLCHAVEELWSMIRKISARKIIKRSLQTLEGSQLPANLQKHFSCHRVVEQTHTSHHHWSLDLRIGRRAAKSVRKQLRGTPYEWMLDLSKYKWPGNVRRPVPVYVEGTMSLGV